MRDNTDAPWPRDLDNDLDELQFYLSTGEQHIERARQAASSVEHHIADIQAQLLRDQSAA